MSLLMSVAAIGAILIGQWPEAAVVIWLFGVAELIEALSLEQARNAIRSLVELAPETASVRRDGGWVTVPTGRCPLNGEGPVEPVLEGFGGHAGTHRGRSRPSAT